jgi:glutathione S-transferase
MEAMQIAVDSALKRIPVKSKEGLVIARERLERAYAWLEGELAGRTWAAGADFTLADCAAAPSLFYADWTHRIPEAYQSPPLMMPSRIHAPASVVGRAMVMM